MKFIETESGVYINADCIERIEPRYWDDEESCDIRVQGADDGDSWRVVMSAANLVQLIEEGFVAEPEPKQYRIGSKAPIGAGYLLSCPECGVTLSFKPTPAAGEEVLCGLCSHMFPWPKPSLHAEVEANKCDHEFDDGGTDGHPACISCGTLLTDAPEAHVWVRQVRAGPNPYNQCEFVRNDGYCCVRQPDHDGEHRPFPEKKP